MDRMMEMKVEINQKQGLRDKPYLFDGEERRLFSDELDEIEIEMDMEMKMETDEDEREMKMDIEM